MTNHPITPPLELVRQWRAEMPAGVFDGYKYPQRETELCIQAAQWGADQELEACCELLKADGYKGKAIDLRNNRRPKPPSLKELALLQLDTLSAELTMHCRPCDLSQIHRALEALPND